MTLSYNNYEKFKEIKSITVKRVISEPADATRYDYVVICNGSDDYSFAPYNNSFRYPQKLNYWEVRELLKEGKEEELVKLAQKENCNPYTLAECIRTILEISKEEKGF